MDPVGSAFPGFGFGFWRYLDGLAWHGAAVDGDRLHDRRQRVLIHQDFLVAGRNVEDDGIDLACVDGINGRSKGSRIRLLAKKRHAAIVVGGSHCEGRWRQTVFQLLQHQANGWPCHVEAP
ncbi:MAG TPA: hypothetical protein VH575_26790 [Gemmataceae bacterium]